MLRLIGELITMGNERRGKKIARLSSVIVAFKLHCIILSQFMYQNAVNTTVDIVVEYLTAWTSFIETSTASVETTIMGKLKSINHQIENLATDLKVDFQRFEAENVESENMLKDLTYKMKHLFNRISGWEKEIKDDDFA